MPLAASRDRCDYVLTKVGLNVAGLPVYRVFGAVWLAFVWAVLDC